jgi:hypothetical protein
MMRNLPAFGTIVVLAICPNSFSQTHPMIIEESRGLLISLLRDQPERPERYEYSSRFRGCDLIGTVLDLAENHPDFERDDLGRRRLVQALMTCAEERTPGLGREFRKGMVADFLISELEAGNLHTKGDVLSEPSRWNGPYRTKVCGAVEEIVREPIDYYSTLEALKALPVVCDDHVPLRDSLVHILIHADRLYLDQFPANARDFGLGTVHLIRRAAAAALFVQPGGWEVLETLALSIQDECLREAVRIAMIFPIEGANIRLSDQEQSMRLDAALRVCNATGGVRAMGLHELQYLGTRRWMYDGTGVMRARIDQFLRDSLEEPLDQERAALVQGMLELQRPVAGCGTMEDGLPPR